MLIIILAINAISAIYIGFWICGLESRIDTLEEAAIMYGEYIETRLGNNINMLENNITAAEYASIADDPNMKYIYDLDTGTVTVKKRMESMTDKTNNEGVKQWKFLNS